MTGIYQLERIPHLRRSSGYLRAEGAIFTDEGRNLRSPRLLSLELELNTRTNSPHLRSLRLLSLELELSTRTVRRTPNSNSKLKLIPLRPCRCGDRRSCLPSPPRSGYLRGAAAISPASSCYLRAEGALLSNSNSKLELSPLSAPKALPRLPTSDLRLPFSSPLAGASPFS